MSSDDYVTVAELIRRESVGFDRDNQKYFCSETGKKWDVNGFPLERAEEKIEELINEE